MSSIQNVRRFVLAVACASTAALPPAAPASARADDAYAAITYSPKTGAYGYGDKYDFRKAAELKALAECNGDDAQLLVWVKNGWCALAVGDGGKYGWSDGNGTGDREEARKTAIAECDKAGGKNSRILICVSSEGKTKKE